MKIHALFVTAILAAAFVCGRAQEPVTLHVDATHPGAAIAPTMFGVFFEDINFGADGGLYPERIKNRSFEFDDPLAGWKADLTYDRDGIHPNKGELDVRTDQPLHPGNPHYLRIRAYSVGYGLTNGGFRGIGLEKDAEYRFSAYVRTQGPQTLRATLTNADGKVLGTATLTGFSGEWKRYEAVFRATGTDPKAVFHLYLDEPGAVDVDMVSLFPVDTWGGRPNGLRKDLVQLLHDMHPGFLRFPGGCIVEGRRLANRYQWKTTVGDVSERRTIMNRWNDEFDTRPTPDYFQSFGLGFYEYFQLAEDIGASPLPILNCGMACQFNSSETAKVEELQEYVQDALDLIEFANGGTETPWGKLRAQMGHPEPFHLKMIGVGNEQWGPKYLERYKVFAEALKAKHPEIALVVSAGPAPGGDEFESLWAHWRQVHADLVDEHYYMSPEWFLRNAGRYDHYDRGGPKVFAGEYAAQTAGQTRQDNANNWQGALAEAAFMTGLERNADVVKMASYAPLLANVDAWQWKPDAIWFDSLRSYGTPNYYVQRVFASNLGTRIVPVSPNKEDGLYVCASLDERTHELVVTAVNTQPVERTVRLDFGGAAAGASAQAIVLASEDLAGENTFEKPENIAPKSSTVPLGSQLPAVKLKANSLSVYRIPLQ